MTGPVLGLDIGGRKLAAGVVAPEGTVGPYLRHVTPGTDSPEEVYAALLDVVDRVLATAGQPRLAGVGAGCGGPMSWPAGDVSPINIPAWVDFPLRARLAERFAGLPVRLHNDAACFAVAEQAWGAAAGYANVLAAVVSTGVGGGLVLADHLVDGGTGNAGHVGHVVVEPEGPACGCGGRGCLEAVARGAGIVTTALEHGWRPEGAATPEAVVAAARTGDAAARRALTRAGRALGVAFASAAALVDLDAIVVGGALSDAGELLLGPCREAYEEHARMGYTRRTVILPGRLRRMAGIAGAAALVLRADRYWSPGEGR